jgi:hypothetical protein
VILSYSLSSVTAHEACRWVGHRQCAKALRLLGFLWALFSHSFQLWICSNHAVAFPRHSSLMAPDTPGPSSDSFIRPRKVMVLSPSTPTLAGTCSARGT